MNIFEETKRGKTGLLIASVFVLFLVLLLWQAIMVLRLSLKLHTNLQELSNNMIVLSGDMRQLSDEVLDIGLMSLEDKAKETK